MTDSQHSRLGRPPAAVDGRTVPERILGAACELFAERGFESTSVKDVVAAAGVTKGAMYHYFASKDDLLAEIYARVLRMQLSRLQSFIEAEGPIPERVAAAASDVVVTTIENLPSTTVFFRSRHLLDPEHERQVRAQRRRYHAMFRQLVLDGQATGEFRKDVQADLIVNYFFGAVHHVPLWWRQNRGLKPTEVGDEYADLLLQSLRPPNPQTR